MAQLRDFNDPYEEDNPNYAEGGLGSAPIAQGDKEEGGAPHVGGSEGTLGGENRGGETPRERVSETGESLAGGAQATTSRPRTPTPMSGGVSQAADPTGGGGGGLIPFQPLGSGGPAPFSGPGLAMGRLFGGARGQTRGGLGVPMDPTSNYASDPISDLLKKILGGF